MTRIHREIGRISILFNALACVAVLIMMLLTCADVVLRLMRHPIPGTYEIISFLGTVIVSFALALTSLEKGHIVVKKLPPRFQAGVDAVACLIGASLFGLICWQSLLYAADMRQSGEVSVTLTMPIYPFIYGVAAGSALLVLVLLSEGLRAAGRTVKR